MYQSLVFNKISTLRHNIIIKSFIHLPLFPSLKQNPSFLHHLRSVLLLKTEKLNNYLHSCNTYLMSGVRNSKSNEKEIIAKGHQVREIIFLYYSWSRLVFLLWICLLSYHKLHFLYELYHHNEKLNIENSFFLCFKSPTTDLSINFITLQ